MGFLTKSKSFLLTTDTRIFNVFKFNSTDQKEIFVPSTPKSLPWVSGFILYKKTLLQVFLMVFDR